MAKLSAVSAFYKRQALRGWDTNTKFIIFSRLHCKKLLGTTHERANVTNEPE